MAQLKDLLVNGASRFIGDLNTNGTTIIGATTTKATNTLTLNGHMVINGTYCSTNTYSQGIRINRSTDGWSLITLGGIKETITGTAIGVWTIGAISNPANDTDTATSSNFIISHNGATGATCRI